MRRFCLLLFLVLVVFSAQAGAFSASEISKAFVESYRYEKMGAYKEAIKALLPLYQEAPRRYLLNLRLGWLYYLSGKYGDAIAYYQKAAEVRPESIEPLLGLSLPLMARGNWGKVERLMNRIISKDPYNYYANLRLAVALRLQNKAPLAEKVARKMLKLYPSSLDFLVELGRIFTWQGKKKEARQIFLRVLLLDPQNVAAREALKK
ncbi:tetratricopeptide repeat protein [Thermosulfuriphilus ammonigenes]|uniref:Tetratricopeptide repeat protein n=1 Tax=Thermosulfuriphilus ammonigenes TaxID=1936021 RepID=A0A6G7PWE4_9BACT|nr:tetratricopeptide repeat protein [Thermosulfuriphilus ammonigenes]MBA2847932.1 tetratricopeptide (TPR) repeat protein [Thermosulfuriphilus ammonigenes]QIJ71876.1 tetratricopeptide repeat protein [Thermosulfuriphilus ammonigenes]